MIIDTLREPKIFNFIIFDWIATFLSAMLIEKIFKVDKWITFIILLIISIPLHIYFKTPTMTNYYLGVDQYPSRIPQNSVGSPKN